MDMDMQTDQIILEQINLWLCQADAGIGQANTLEKLTTGQSNPTYHLTTDQGQFILRMQPSGTLLPSAHAVDREFRVMQALKQTSVPVPIMISLCTDQSFAGVKFYIMENIDGMTIADPSLSVLNKADRHRIYDQQIDILAQLTCLDPDHIGLSDFGRPSGYLDRQIAIWSKQYRNSETEHLADMEYLMAKLPGQFDTIDLKLCVIHGDYRIDNLIISKDKPHNVKALIDWELSTLGPAFIDLSYFCAMLRLPEDLPISGLGMRDRHQLGLPEEQDLIDQYCQQTGLTQPDNWQIWIAFQLFRFAAILQGVRKRHLDGNASALNAAEVGGQTNAVAALAAATLKQYLSES